MNKIVMRCEFDHAKVLQLSCTSIQYYSTYMHTQECTLHSSQFYHRECD